MDGLAVVMMGAGLWVCYSAIKNESPLKSALSILGSNTGAPKATTSSATGSSTAVLV
jgi:hypothetical protein